MGMTTDDDILALLFDRDLGFNRFLIAENSLMQIRRVAQVEEIVDDELVICPNGDTVAFGGMDLRYIVEDAEVRHLRSVGRLFPHPDPDRLVLLDHRIAAHPRARRDVLAAMGIVHAGA